MRSGQVLADAYGRVGPALRSAVEGLTEDQLAHRADPDANSIAWLAWHVVRLQDASIAGALDLPDLWTADGWGTRFAIPLEPDDIGYGHTSEQVGSVRVDADLLLAYADAVQSRTQDRVAALTDADLDRVVDPDWDPPVTLGVRLVSVLADDLQHVGQAAILRGLLERDAATGGG